MRAASEFQPPELVGKRVVFRDETEHAHCWHTQVGLQAGRVLRPGQTLAQKATLLDTEGIGLPPIDPELLEQTPRVWVFADGCPAFPRGCETSVPLECLLVKEGER